MQGGTLPFLLVSSTNTVRQPCRECTPIHGLITGDKDKSRSEEGTDEHSGGGGGGGGDVDGGGSSKEKRGCSSSGGAGWQFAVEWLIK